MIITFEEWLGHQKKYNSNSMWRYRRIEEHFIKFLFKTQLPLEEISLEYCEKYIEQIRKDFITPAQYISAFRKYLMYLDSIGLVDASLKDFIYSREKRISKESLKEKINSGQSKEEIRKELGLASRSSIIQYAKDYNIPLEDNSFRRNEIMNYAIDKLKSIGVKVEEVKGDYYNLLVNDHLKLDVVGSYSKQKNAFHFSLCESKGSQAKSSLYREVLYNKKVKKRYHLTCDIIIFIGVENNIFNSWIMPSSAIEKNIQALALFPYSLKSKYKKWEENWELILNELRD